MTTPTGPKQQARNSQFSKTKLCRFELLGMCAKGEKCPFAHGGVELRALPDLRCTKLCKELLTTGQCSTPSCFYAHSKHELRSTSTKNDGKKHMKRTANDAREAGVVPPPPPPHTVKRSQALPIKPPGLEDFNNVFSSSSAGMYGGLDAAQATPDMGLLSAPKDYMASWALSQALQTGGAQSAANWLSILSDAEHLPRGAAPGRVPVPVPVPEKKSNNATLDSPAYIPLRGAFDGADDTEGLFAALGEGHQDSLFGAGSLAEEVAALALDEDNWSSGYKGYGGFNSGLSSWGEESPDKGMQSLTESMSGLRVMQSNIWGNDWDSLYPSSVRGSKELTKAF
eukprot:TRINITY_DN63870_c0_g1_i1.p1 TRINITY_DN63870_c0_g1~~TRINITY_DN63870_c0_g1_i1.p1  ORF type:complete len:340 (-),score=70.34 TRINITY_DN63870_c0_g1_i1:250-1269(-)